MCDSLNPKSTQTEPKSLASKMIYHAKQQDILCFWGGDVNAHVIDGDYLLIY